MAAVSSIAFPCAAELLLLPLLLSVAATSMPATGQQMDSSTTVQHPRLYFSISDLPHLRSKKHGKYMGAVLQQYADAMMHRLNYSSGGVMVDVSSCSNCGTQHQLAAALYVAGFGNTTRWGQICHDVVLAEVLKLTPSTGNWFAASERNLQQLVGSYDVTAGLFNKTEKLIIENAFALNANFLAGDPGCVEGCVEGVPADMASRLMNPAADRLAALGLIALTFPKQPNASAWLAQSISEFKWMLANGVMEDGQWHEPSTRYHGRVLAAFIPFAYALRQAEIMDAFNDDENLKKFVGWYRLVQTPPDATMGGCALTPALSDSNWETVWEVTMGWAAGAYAQSDPTYSSELWSAWERACAPAGLEPSPPAWLATLLFIGCAHAGECGESLTEPFSGRNSRPPKRQSNMLSGYAVLEQPSLASRPYMIMSTATQRQTEGHEHPDRGSFSLYSHGTPMILDPGVGWCGYQWFATIPSNRYNGTFFDRGLQYGAWYRGSQAHSMVNFAKEGGNQLPENETWRPAGAYGHEWGLRGAAWVDVNLFSDAIDYVDLNVTRAVQASQLPRVASYHRRVFGNRRDDSYLLWDFVDAPAKDCAQAEYNLHVVTQMGWPGKVGCSVSVSTNNAESGQTQISCKALNNLTMDLTVLRPLNVTKRNLLHLEVDPLPVQFTGMTGSAGSAPGMPNTGGALGGDWNAHGGVPPKDPYWPARTPTWIRIDAGDEEDTSPSAALNETSACSGFLTLLQPRNITTKRLISHLVEDLSGGAVTLHVRSPSTSSSTYYFLGTRATTAWATFHGVAGVVGWQTPEHSIDINNSSPVLDHVELIECTLFAMPRLSLSISLSSPATMALRSPHKDQYIIKIERTTAPVTVTAVLPWSTSPTQINVWRGAHVWHVSNSSLGSDQREPTVEFEALPGMDYLIENQCIWSMKAGYGEGGWLCDTRQS